MEKSTITEYAQIIDLGLGHPALELLPQEQFRLAALKVLDDREPALLQYGPDEGGRGFRQTLAGWLTRQYGEPVLPESLFISSGISQALDLVCTVFSRPGDMVFVEEPTYFYVYDIFKNHNLQLVSIPQDEGGIDVDLLARKLKQHRPAFLYTIPVFHNPSALTLSGERRKLMADMSREHDFLIVSDEAYQFLDYEATPPPAFALAGQGGNILSLGSFSKILGPGLRLGWIHAAAEQVSRLARAGFVVSGGGLNPVMGEIAGRFIELGFQDRQLAVLKEAYRERCRVLCEAVDALLPGNSGYKKPEGGFFLWLKLPDGTDAADLLVKARAKGVAFKPGFLFSDEKRLRNYIRLSFSYYSPELIREGVRRLGTAEKG